MAWLQALPRHSIFTLPPSPSDQHTSPFSTHPSVGELARPASPGASPILNGTRGAALSQSASSKSLFGLSSPGALKRSSFAKSQRLNGAAKEAEGAVRGGRKVRMVVVRGTEVVVAVGRELRMASLADVKARCHDEEDALDEDMELGEYKVLNTPTINFEIQQLVLNSTSKLLAVVGAHSVVVVVLPRKGWANSLGKTLDCRSLPVGKFYHALPGSPLVAQTLWHPWGEHASSLLVLTADSLLREYNISEDVEEPAQTLSFTRSAEDGKSARGGFSAEDEDASRAVGMCVGEGKGDWGPLTLYALMQNGDVVSLCPFLPKKASVPPSYVQSLAAFVSAKVDFLASTEAASGAVTRFDPFASTTSSSSALHTPSKALAVSSRASASSHPSPRTPAAFSKRYNLQLQYVNSLLRQLSSSKTRTPSTEVDADATPADEDEDAPVRLVSPSRADFTPSLQGPFLLQPAPAELDNGADPRACDIAYLSYSSSSSANEGVDAPGVGVIAIAYADGKVDLCLEVEKVEARWAAEEDKLVLASSARPRRGGYGLDADDADEDGAGAGDGVDTDALPTLAVYETIDLGLADELNPSRSTSAAAEKLVARALADNHPTLVRDPLYADTLYVHHALGAHCLLLGGWLEGLAEAAAEEEGEGEDEAKAQKEIEGRLKALSGTEVVWVLKTLASAAAAADADERGEVTTPPVVGLQVVNDVYLGYSLLLLTSAFQLAGIELSLRVGPSASDLAPAPASSSSAATSKTASTDPPAYVSLLDTPFTIPPILASRSGAPRLPSTPGGSKELSITPDTLRALGMHVSAVQSSVRELVSAADEVQHRLELQMKELARQLSKLAELKQLRSDLGKSTSAAASEGSVEARLQRVEANQRRLIERTDRVLQRLMEQHQPEISTYERKWFDELGRLEKQVEGGGAGERQPSLEVRARRVGAMFEELRPALEEMRRREEAKAAAAAQGAAPGTPTGRGGMGQAQLRLLEGKLADEAKLLSDAKRKVERLTSALAASSLQ
ncbi:hypothetical protein JCM6882_009679 [Rhodosporidiobolus microsporus]